MKPTPTTQGELITEKKKRPPKDTYNVNSIKERKYHTLDVGEYYSALFGEPESKFIAMLYGLPAGGKSVFALQLANFLAENHGKTYYNSHEERIKMTIQNRVNEYNINAKRLWFGDAVPFNRLMDKIQKNHYRFVFIDSVQYMGLTFDQLHEMSARFKKRLLSIIMIGFGSSWGNADKARDLLYSADIKGFFALEGDYGIAKFSSRYKPTIVKTELFKVSEEVIKKSDFKEVEIIVSESENAVI